MKKQFRQKFKSQRGFTLIETLLYIGLFALVMTAILLVTHQLIEYADKSQARAQIELEAQFIFHKIDEVLNGADTMVITENTGVQALSIINPNLADGQSLAVISRDSANNAILLERGSGRINKLNATIAPVTSLDFVITTSEIAQTVRTTFVIMSPILATPQTYTSVRTIRKNIN